MEQNVISSPPLGLLLAIVAGAMNGSDALPYENERKKAGRDLWLCGPC